MPVTDAKQRVTPALPKHEEWLDHAEISFITDIKHRNKRLVVHHYASRSFKDYETKLSRGAGTTPAVPTSVAWASLTPSTRAPPPGVVLLTDIRMLEPVVSMR